MGKGRERERRKGQGRREKGRGECEKGIGGMHPCTEGG